MSLTIQLNSYLFTQLNDQTVQFSLSHLFAHSLNVKQFYLIHSYDCQVLPTPGQSGQGSNGKEGVLHIPQSSKAIASPSDSPISYVGHSLGES